MFEPGTQIGRYEIQRRLGRGGMGAVYGAHDPVLGRMVAIKVFTGDIDIPDARERFEREARSAAALSHPNIVTIYDFGEVDAQPYIVMEYVGGETLAQLIRRKADVPLVDRLRWIEELCFAAGYAHHRAVIHRDLKPANLMVDRALRLRVLDFGIARLMGASSQTTAALGTPGYMAPEQIEGERVDHRADLFSIGVVMYELVAYAEAFPGDTTTAITHKILSHEPVPLEQAVPGLHPEIAAICARALKKKPADRFESAEAMRVALSRTRNEIDPHSGMATTAVTIAFRDTPRPGTPTPGSGSGRPLTGGPAVAPPTPPPTHRPSDREALARRRTELLSAALEAGRSALEAGDLNGAMDACQRALAFDESHAGALDLEQRILAARSVFEAPTIPSGPVGTVAPEPTAAVASAVQPATAIAPAAMPEAGPPKQRSRRAIVAAGLVAVAATAAVIAWSLRGAAPSGTLVIDATPWATITAIEGADGERLQLPAAAYTPLTYTLPPGTYKVSLTGPPPQSKTESVTAHVGVGGITVLPIAQLSTITAEEYFDQYLGAAR